MNKRFSTLLTAGLLMAGALFSSAKADNAFAEFPTGTKLADGVKVYLADDATPTNGALKVNEVVKDKVYSLAGTATVSQASLFILDAVKEQQGVLTFQLKDEAGHVIALKTNGDVATSVDDALAKTFYVAKDATLDNPGAIKVLNAGGAATAQLTVAASTGAYAYAAPGTGATPFAVKFLAAAPKKVTAADLNANLSGKGFKFAFPTAKSAPDVNPFDIQMLAIDMPVYSSSASSYAGANGVVEGTYFAVANDKATALQAAIAAQAGDQTVDKTAATLAAFKAATFVVLDPNANFGITGLVVSEGEGYGFTTVKGDKLAGITANVKKDGKINCANAAFEVRENDCQNAPGEYTIEIKAAKVDGDKGTPVSNLLVGAYSLTTGGLKTYVTTAKTNAADLFLAQASNNTWAQASDLLKTDNAAIYNIIFAGEKPADKVEADASVYGKYMVSKYTDANFTIDTIAPKNVELTYPVAQWVVVAANGHAFTFQNRETNAKITMNLYKTDKDDEFMIAGEPTVVGAAALAAPMNGLASQIIRVAQATTSKLDGFFVLTNDMKDKKAELVFNGTNNVVVKELFMEYVAGTTNKYAANKSDLNSVKWTVEPSASVTNKIKYAYLKADGTVDKADTALVVNAYILADASVSADAKYLKADFSRVVKASAQQYIFKKNLDGTFVMVPVTITSATEYEAVIVKNMKVVNANNTGTFVATETIASDPQYSKVSIEFNRLTVSLEAVERHATLDGEDGSVSMKLNKNGILEGIISNDALTFWLDTADIDQEIPSFYISNGIKDSEVRNFMYYAADSLTHWDDAAATYITNENYQLEGTEGVLKAIFRPATIAAIDTIATTVDGKSVLVAEEEEDDVCLGGVNNFKFNIMLVGDNQYVIMPLGKDLYLYNLNGKLGFTSVPEEALVITLGNGDATSNEEAPAVATIKVVAGEGNVQIAGAAGKKVVVSNILGQVIANTVVTSDNATIATPAGIVVVAVEGEAAVKAIVK